MRLDQLPRRALGRVTGLLPAQDAQEHSMLLRLRGATAISGEHDYEILAQIGDDEGSLLLASEHGIALLDDRDLAAMAAHLVGELEQPDAPIRLDWGGRRLPVERIAQADVPARFGFVGQPA